MIIKAGDVIIASLSGSLNNIGLVPKQLDEELANTVFFIINSERSISEFLFLFFRSEILKIQLEQMTAGAIMAAIPKGVFGDLLVPLIPKQKQEKIIELVKQSDEAMKRSEKVIV
ncbi:MAG: hypothetical protein NT106_08185 [Candidatus Sumerlaeota bacterium]|nr:hypothetical protein [Candidatus Sumerlaeota bacterium]